jgi:hypothetical protein
VLVALFLTYTVVNARDAVAMDHSRSDMHMFYAGVNVLLSGNRAQLYDVDTQVREVTKIREGDVPSNVSSEDPPYVWYRYYNPPIFFLGLAPLSLVSPHDAYLIGVGANLVLLGVLAIAIGFVLRWRQPHVILIWLALPAFAPTYVTLQHGQPTFLIAALLCATCLALRDGRGLLAGVLLAFVGLKPNWLVIGLSLASNRRVLLAFLGSSAILLAAPYVVLGPGTIVDYLGLVLSRGAEDTHNPELGTAVVSWAGFFQALTGEAQPWLWLLASIVTLAAFGIVWRFLNEMVRLAAAIPAALLIVPHSHAQDLMLLTAAAAILLSLRWSTLALTGINLTLLGAFLGGNTWNEGRLSALAGHPAIYWVSLACFGIVAWLAAVALLERQRPAEVQGGASQGRLRWDWAARGWLQHHLPLSHIAGRGSGPR